MFSSKLDRWVKNTINSESGKNDIYLKPEWEYNHVRDYNSIPVNFEQHSPELTDIKQVVANLKAKGVSVDDINELYNTWIIFNDVRYLPKEKIYEMFYKKIKEYLNYVSKRTPLLGKRAYKTEKLTEGDGLSDHYYRLYESSANIHADLRSIQKTIDSNYAY